MRGLLADASRRTVLATIAATPVTAMLHAHASPATMASSGSRQTTAMQPAAVPALCDRLDFALLGDIMLGRYVDDQFEVAERKRGAFGDVLPVLTQLDPSCSIVAGNLECAGRADLKHSLCIGCRSSAAPASGCNCSLLLCPTAVALKSKHRSPFPIMRTPAMEKESQCSEHFSGYQMHGPTAICSTECSHPPSHSYSQDLQFQIAPTPC